MLKKIATTKAPAAIGPYSQAIAAGDFLFASGQIPINPENGQIEAQGIEEQAEQVMKNIGAILEEAGTDYSKVVKTSCFLADMKDFPHSMAYMRNISPRSRQEAVWRSRNFPKRCFARWK